MTQKKNPKQSAPPVELFLKATFPRDLLSKSVSLVEDIGMADREERIRAKFTLERLANDAGQERSVRRIARATLKLIQAVEE